MIYKLVLNIFKIIIWIKSNFRIAMKYICEYMKYNFILIKKNSQNFIFQISSQISYQTAPKTYNYDY